MKALIDGDIILYSVGFASEKRWYECSDGKEFDTAKEAKEYCQEVIGDSGNGDFGYRLCRERVEDKVWKGNTNAMIDSILDVSRADEYMIYFTGKGNYRAELYPEYKANRADLDKPLHYQEIKEYIEKTRVTETVNGMEADDAMGIHQHGLDTAICSLDKDMDMIAGRHYNWNKGRYTVAQEDADRWFWMQLLMGDKTDNIPGLHRVGPKGAEKILAECTSNEDMYKAVLQAYEEREVPVEDMERNGHLLWIKRSEDSTWKDLISG